MLFMNYKRISGIVLIVIGVLLIALSLYTTNQVSMKMGKVHNATSNISQGSSYGGSKFKKAGSQISGAINAKAGEKASPYQVAATWELIGGVLFIIIGGGVIFFTKGKKGR